jgi:hypothetical protein
MAETRPSTTAITRQQAAAYRDQNLRAAQKTLLRIRNITDAALDDIAHLRPADPAVSQLEAQLAELRKFLADARAYGRVATWLQAPAA